MNTLRFAFFPQHQHLVDSVTSLHGSLYVKEKTKFSISVQCKARISSTFYSKTPPMHPSNCPHLALPITPTILLFLRGLLHCARPDAAWLLACAHRLRSALPSTREFIPEILLVLGGSLRWCSKRVPKVFLLRFPTGSATVCTRVRTLYEAVKCGSCVGNARLDTLTDKTGRVTGLRSNISFGELEDC